MCATFVLALTAHTALGLDNRYGVYAYVPTIACGPVVTNSHVYLCYPSVLLWVADMSDSREAPYLRIQPHTSTLLYVPISVR
jgi:hypothetical protein